MSKDKYELSIIKTAGDISYVKPEHSNSLVSDSEYDKVDKAISKGVVITDAGTTLVNEEELHDMLGESKKDTKFIVDNKLSDSEKTNINNKLYIKSGAVLKEVHTRAEEHPDASKRAKNRYTEKSIIRISESSEVKAQKGDFEDFAKKEEKKLPSKRQSKNKEKKDEITDKPLNGNGEFHHKNKKTIYPDSVERLDPEKGVLVNKDTHKDIHINNINNEEQLEKYKKGKKESSDK